MTNATDSSGRTLVLELARAQAPQDPYAFRFEPQSYTLRTDGGGRETVEVDWSPALLSDLEELRRADRDPAVVQRVGDTLARFLERASWPARARAIADAHDAAASAAAAGAGQRVTIVIRSAAAELYALPWELVTLPGRGQHLGALPRVLLRYERPETATARESPSPRPEGGRVLLAWSAAAGSVPAAAHEAGIRSACARGHPEGGGALEVLPHASVAGIVGALQQAQRSGRPFAALHLLCHGGRAGGSFGLVLDGDARSVTVAADTWRTMLAPFAGSLRLVVLCACEGGNAGEPGNHLGSVAQAVHAVGLEAVVASRQPLSTPGSIVLVESLYESLLVEHASLEESLLRARARLALDPTRLDWAAIQLHARADDGLDVRPFVFRPYRGLLAFAAEQAAFFHGREAERRRIAEGLEALTRAGKPRLVVVAGASGTGKSSLVHAGAVPDVLATRGGIWEHAVLRPGDAPLAALEAVLDARKDPGRPLLLVVDQFEEVFTHVRAREARLAFARRLWALVREDTGVSCILALRIDFLGRCGELWLDDAGARLDAIAYDDAHRVLVAQPSVEQLRAAITRPAQQVGLVLPAGLAERIASEVAAEPGALPLVQYTLDRLWQCRRGRALSLETYEELGGVVGALERMADALLDSLSDDDLHHARSLLTRLVGLGEDDAGDTRRRVPLEQLLPDPPQASAAEALLRRFVDERLVVRDDHNRAGATAELAHEALIRRWGRLREWLAEERERRIGRYVVLERVSERSREQVFRGFDPELDRRVTIRLLRVGRAGAQERTRLRDQARALTRLAHPNAQAVFDVGVLRGHVYMALEPVEGVSVRDWQEQGQRPWHEVVEAFAKVADALAVAHELGLLHRALAPEAIRIDDRGVPRVVGFMLDRRIDAAPAVRGEQTLVARYEARRSGPGVAATPEASARPPVQEPSVPAFTTESTTVDGLGMLLPEQLQGQPLGPASDQFGLCMAMFEVLLGKRPVTGEGLAAFAQAVVERQRSATTSHEVIPEGLRKVLLRGMAHDPAERWPSMAALRDELRVQLGPRARRAARPERARRVALGAVFGVVVAGVGWAASTMLGSEPAAVPPACDETQASLAGAWDQAQRERVRDAMFATSRPEAVALWKRIEPELDAYAAAWLERATRACEVPGVGGPEPADAALRRACLDARRVDLREAVDALTRIDARTLEQAMPVVERLPGLAPCDDAEALRREAAAAGDAARSELVEQLAATRLELARRLWEVPAQRERARALAEQARDAYTTLGPEHAGLAEARAWLSSRGSNP